MANETKCDFCDVAQRKERNKSNPWGSVPPGWARININGTVSPSKEEEIAPGSLHMSVDVCPECVKEKNLPFVMPSMGNKTPERQLYDAISDIIDEVMQSYQDR